MGVATLLLTTAAQAGQGYILGAGVEADNADGRAVSGFVDYGLTRDTWISAALARTSTSGVLGGLDTTYADVGFEHFFGLAGIRAGAAYWGDKDILDSNDLNASIFFRGEAASVSFDYERRNFDFTFRSLLYPDQFRTIDFYANGIGLSASLKAGERIRLFASGMGYDYSRELKIQPQIDSLAPLSRSRLSLMNSLIDYHVNGGISYQFEKNAIDLTVGSWQTAVDGGKVHSVALGFTLAAGDAFDLDVRVAYDRSDNYGDTVGLAISMFYFGG